MSILTIMNYESSLLSALAIGALGVMIAWNLIIPLIVGLLDRGR